MTTNGFGRFLLRVTACHVVTYTIAGILAYTLFNYATTFESGDLASFMKPTSSKWVTLGPAFQLVRGLIFAVVLYPFRRVIVEERRGWLNLWGLLFGIGILSTYGPAPGSVEGIVYTKLPVLGQILGLREIVAQSLAFSLLLVAWYRRPHRAWGIVMYTLTAVALLLSVAGTFLPRPETFR